jgi:hypothetical protein
MSSVLRTHDTGTDEQTEARSDYLLDKLGRQGKWNDAAAVPSAIIAPGVIAVSRACAAGIVAHRLSVLPCVSSGAVLLRHADAQRCRHVAQGAIGMPLDGPPALPSNGIDKEKELLQALERRGGITAARAALETSLSVTEAEKVLSGLANKGHVLVSANGGRLAYALWEQDRRQARRRKRHRSTGEDRWMGMGQARWRNVVNEPLDE